MSRIPSPSGRLLYINTRSGSLSARRQSQDWLIKAKSEQENKTSTLLIAQIASVIPTETCFPPHYFIHLNYGTWGSQSKTTDKSRVFKASRSTYAKPTFAPVLFQQSYGARDTAGVWRACCAQPQAGPQSFPHTGLESRAGNHLQWQHIT